MEVILIDDVFELGKRGELVRVADGYGRNYLIPKKLAVPATKGNQKMIEQQRLALAKKEAKYKEDAEILAGEISQYHLLISRKCGETGTLFGSVTSKDLTGILQQTGIELDRRKVHLDQPIKSIGNYQVPLHLHSDVPSSLLVSVLSEGDEPVATIRKRDEESETIIAQLEAKLEKIEHPEGAGAAGESVQEEPEPPDSRELSFSGEPGEIGEPGGEEAAEEQAGEKAE